MRFIALVIVLLLALHASPQSKLSTSIQQSPKAYVYKISAKEAEALTLTDLKKVNDKFLYALVDSFNINAKVPKLSTGNYLLMSVVKNQEYFQLHTAGDLDIQVLQNSKKAFVAVYTSTGVIINDAVVYAGRKKLEFNKATQTYGAAISKKAKLVRVQHDGAVYFFKLNKSRHRKPGLVNRIAYSFPLKYIVKPIDRLIKRIRDDDYYYRSPDFFGQETEYENKFKGFMVFNKPKYKPGDTVKLKAFVQTNKGTHLNYPLIVRLTDESLVTDTVIATIHPYRASGYEYQFVLSDSLELDLDEKYMVTLERLASKKYDLDTYEGDLDEDEYAIKRKVVIRGKFEYEEYELRKVTFNARSSKTEHHRGEELAVLLKATDENEMAIMDGRAEITIRRVSSYNLRFYSPIVFVPDTLWRHNQQLDNLGETKIIVPDSIFPKADFKYEIKCVFLDAANERRQEILSQTFINDPREIVFEQKADSLSIKYFIAGKATPLTAELYTVGKNDTLEQRTISLPATIEVNPFVFSYAVKAGNLHKSHQLKYSKGMVSSLGTRTADSVFIQLTNPYRLPVWYTIFAGEKLVLSGYNDELNYKARSQTRKNYFISVQYVYAGKLYKDEYTIPYANKMLTIKMDQLEFVYPGQTTSIGINVTDVSGKPVSGADLTAYAYTSKFGNYEPNVPYMSKVYPYRTQPSYNLTRAESKYLSRYTQLNWERWSHEMNLDAIEYYKFTHPKDRYLSTEPVVDSITQIAPFVVSKGDVQPIHCLYINSIPYFFSKTQHLQRYSFKVREGWNHLRLRTHDKEVTVDSVFVKKGMKTFLSINADSVSRHVTIRQMPDTLERHEQQLWNRYMILMENSFGENLAYVRQDEKVFLLNAEQKGGTVLTGPINDYGALLTVKNKFEQHFFPEGGWQFNITKGLIKQRQYRDPILFSKDLSETAPLYNFKDFVLTAKEIDSLWQEYLDWRSSTAELFSNEALLGTDRGELIIGFDMHLFDGPGSVKNVILFRHGNPDYIRVYPGNRRELGYLQPAMYKLLFLLKDGKYFIRDSVQIIPNGINYFEIQPGVLKPKDSISNRIIQIIENRAKGDYSSPSFDLDRIKQTFNRTYMSRAEFSELIGGVVRDKEGNPVPFASVMVKGTNVGTTTNADGEYTLRTPPHAVIIVSAVGHDSWEVQIYPGIGTCNVELFRTPKHMLSEVVVVGYGALKKRSAMAFASTNITSALQGKVAGVYIRGASTVNSRPPLIFVDGVPYNGDLNKMDTSQIALISVMEADKARAIYGSRADNGVILITTKGRALATGFDEPMPQNAIRRNFRDDAFWQPRLMTDAKGNASFTVTFPDDITNWSTYVVAMGNKKQSGYFETNIKSFKALSGNVVLPQFTIEGDSINVIGKTLNYTSDSVRVKRSFSVNDRLFKENILSVRNALIDTFSIAATGKDSLKVKYTIQQDNGYADGEERSIPIFKPGTVETLGMFASLTRDTTFVVTPRTDNGTMKLYAESSLLPVWYAEAESIRNYEYLCNEQLASKLKAMLVQKRIDSFYKRPFNGEKNILDLINRLSQNKSKSGLWDWWRGDGHTMWISLHVVEALMEAGSMGYKVDLNKTWLTDYLVFNLENYHGTEKISSLFLLQLMNSKVDYKRYIDSIEAKKIARGQYEKLRLVELKQKVGIPVTLDTLIAKKRQTMFGNVYWGEEGYWFFENSIQITLAMYRILKNAGGHDELLERIRNYFLEKRKDGNWRNTYEASLILQTILPDLLTEDALTKATSLTLAGKENRTVLEFPFSTELKSGEKITVTKRGTMPVYFAAFERTWNTSPEKLDGNFIVNSVFLSNRDTISKLKAGQPVKLNVTIHVKADAEYVMVEIPIPAGCSYYDKSQYWSNNEVHREHFKNKVSIFCKSLRGGTYKFTVTLLPRFTGVYTLNPAKAEMMYFPVFVGREGMKKVRIE